MKKAKKMIVTVVVIPAALFLAFFILIENNADLVFTAFADKVLIEFKYGDNIHRPFVKEVESGDAQRLKRIINGKLAWPDSPSCPCGGLNIIFQSKNKKIIVSPTLDECPTVAFGNERYFYLSERENKEVREILKKYGVVYPF